jgi:hypothetical protein
MFPRWLDVRDRILRYDAAIVFHLHVELIVRQHSFPQLQDLGEAVRPEPMIDIRTDVRLEQDSFGSPGHTAAIDEIFHHVPDFSDMGVRRDEVAIRQNKPRKRAWLAFERRAEIR